MIARHVLSLVLFGAVAGVLLAQDGIGRGIVRKIDADAKTVVVDQNGKDVTLTIKAQTRVVDAAGQASEDPFKEKVFTVGEAIFFKKDDGGDLVAVRVAGKEPKNSGIQRGTLVKVEPEKLTVTLKQDGKEIVAVADEKTLFFEAKGTDAKEKLGTFKAGADVNFVVRPQGDGNYLVGIRSFDAKPPAKFAKVDSSKLVPIDELGDAEYKDGFKGGFYPGGNKRPAAHEAAGVALGESIQPLDTAGKPAEGGKIVMLSVGMSNTSQASGGFQKALRSAEGVNPKFLFVNGAVGGQTAAIVQSTETPQGAKYWAVVDDRLKMAGSSREQVQIVWIKQADAGPSQGFPAYAKKLEEELAKIVQILPKRFPNTKIVYLSSRTYGGFATTGLNPEPYAYESGFSVKWLIERQLKGEAGLNFDAKKGEVTAPWLSWGPYLWANGTKKRAADGFFYEQSDFGDDGTHHSAAGSEKIGQLMVRFFQSDTTSRPWFGAKAK